MQTATTETQTPLVSVVILGALDQGSLQTTLETIASQSLAGWEIIVLGSVAAEPMVQVFQGRIGAHRLRFLFSEGLGTAQALDQGIRLATGEFVLTVHSGDRLQPNSLANLIKCTETTERTCIAYGALRCGPQTYYPGDQVSLSRIRRVNTLPSSCLFPRSLWLEAGALPRLGAEEPFWNLWLSALERGCSFRGVAEVVITTNRTLTELGVSDAPPRDATVKAHPALYAPTEVSRAGGRGERTGKRCLVVSSAEVVNGDLEVFARELATALFEEGSEVDLVFTPVSNNLSVPVHTTSDPAGIQVRWLAYRESLQPVLAEGRYSNILMFSVPDAPMIEELLAAQGVSERILCLTHGAPSPELSRQAQEEGVAVVDVPLGVSAASTSATGFARRFGLAEDKRILLSVGTIQPGGSQAALAQMAERFPSDTQLVFVGPLGGTSPRYHDEFLELVHRMPRVTYLGALSDHDTTFAVQEASVVLIPGVSVSSLGGMLRAMSHGTPWLATPALGVGDTTGGFITSLGGFPNAVETLIANPDMVHDLRDSGFEEYLFRHSIRASLALTRELVRLARKEQSLPDTGEVLAQVVASV